MTVVVLFTRNWDIGVHAFSKGISLRVNVIEWLEFELACCGVTVQNAHGQF